LISEVEFLFFFKIQFFDISNFLNFIYILFKFKNQYNFSRKASFSFESNSSRK